MGLPIWRNPTETQSKQNNKTKSKSDADPTASARSSIRRRPEIRRGHFPNPPTRARPPPPPPRLERTSSLYSPRRNDSRARHGAPDELPPIRNLFETMYGPPSGRPRPGYPSYSSSMNDRGDADAPMQGDGNDASRQEMMHHLLNEPVPTVAPRDPQPRPAVDSTTESDERAQLGYPQVFTAEDIARAQQHMGTGEQARLAAVEERIARREQASNEWRSRLSTVDLLLGQRQALSQARSQARMRRQLAAARAPPTPESNARPQSRDGQVGARALPSPPHEDSGSPPSDELDALAAWLSTRSRPSHPLQQSWRPGSPPIDGLGDRARSPTPGVDAWEIMQTTLTPDETLPSAESSFAPTAASRSFGANELSQNQSTSSRDSLGNSNGFQSFANRTIAEIDRSLAREPSDSALGDDEPCDADDDVDEDDDSSDVSDDESVDMNYTPEDLGEAMFRYVDEHCQVRVRIEDIQNQQATVGVMETPIQLGLRLFEIFYAQTPEALMSDPDVPDCVGAEVMRRTLMRTSTSIPRDFTSPWPANVPVMNAARNEGRRSVVDVTNAWEILYGLRTTQGSNERVNTMSEPAEESLTPHVEQMQASIRQVIGAGMVDSARSHPDALEAPRAASDGGRGVDARDEQHDEAEESPSVPHPIVSADIQDDFDSLRRIVDRLAARDDVPEDLWMSIGLNLSRTRPRSRDRQQARRAANTSSNTDRVRSGRVGRSSTHHGAGGNSRL